MLVHRLGALAAAALLAAACAGSPTGPSPTEAGENPSPPFSPIPLPAATASPQVFVGAGDIAMCDANSEATARLLDGISGTVFALGDNAYFQGSRENYRNCYEPTWGRHKGRTRPVPGNHDYESPGAGPYFEYFGANAGPSGRGYYSFELGAWHAVALNSNVDAGAGSAQVAWLRNDLAASQARCTIAYWHHPLFSSGRGSSPHVRDLWQVLSEFGAEVVLAGHDHFYERFAPQDADGRPDPARGIRQFVVGTGGAMIYQPGAPRANSEARLPAFGVLRLTLQTDSYQWDFVAVTGGGDTGTGSCH
jgi:3',5'-cyclic AMP phosphodiesterase CpdA